MRNQISAEKIRRNIIFAFLCIFYAASEFGASRAAISKVMFHVGEHLIPFSSFAGVFSSVVTLVLICWVVFYGKIGFYTSLVILTLRLIRLVYGLVFFHFTSLPAIFMTIVAYVSVFTIYIGKERHRRAQMKFSQELTEFIRSFIHVLAKLIDGKDPYTNGHSFRVAKYTQMLAKKLGENGIPDEMYYNIGLMHDIGKISIPDSILLKAGKLTPEEYEIMKSHAQRGYEFFKDVRVPQKMLDGIHYHHERYDGTGYPEGISGERIPLIARIIAVADAFDAMSSSRPYREKLKMDVIVQEIKDCTGSQFDPKVADAFMELYEEGAFADLT